MIGEYLRRKGGKVVYAADGEKGLVVATAEHPDLILCDLDMPALDGLGVIVRLREDAALNETPVIFISGSKDSHQIRQSMNLGGDDFLAKPAQLQDIFAAVKARLERSQQQRQRQVGRVKKAVELFSGIVDDLGSKTAGFQWLAQMARTSETKTERERPSPNNPPTGMLTPTAALHSPSLLVKNAGRCGFIQLSEIKVFLACGEYSKAFWSKTESMMFRKSLNKWQQELPNTCFVRVHRQAIINLNFLNFVSNTARQKTQVHLREFLDAIPVSQRRKAELNRRLKTFQPLTTSSTP